MRIRFSKDYDDFVFHKANRELRPKKVASLKIAMARMNLLPNAPIICKLKKGSVKEIFDGQHRYKAAKELKIPIAFTLLDDNKEIDCRVDMSHVAQFNAESDNWSVEDAIHHYVVMGNPHYIDLTKFMDEYKFNPTLSAVMLSAKTAGDTKFKNVFFHDAGKTIRQGEFKVLDYAFGCKIADSIYDFRPYFKNWKNRSFCHAIMHLTIGKKYVHKKMLDKVDKYDGLLKFQATTADFIENIQYVYNYKTNQANRVNFC
jgi:hypothetical protein